MKLSAEAVIWKAKALVLQCENLFKRGKGDRKSTGPTTKETGYIDFMFNNKLKSPRGTWEKAMATHSSTLAWKILWTEEPGRLQSMGS